MTSSDSTPNQMSPVQPQASAVDGWPDSERRGPIDMRLPRIAALAAAAMLALVACGDGDEVATIVPDAEDPAVTTPAPEDAVVEE
jgi:hypothetical protein